MFTFKQLHELVHSLTPSEDEAFRAVLAKRRSVNLRLLYETLRGNPYAECAAYKRLLPPEIYGALRVYQVRLREALYDFLASNVPPQYPMSWLLAEWGLLLRGLFDPLYARSDAVGQSRSPLKEEIWLAHQRVRILSHILDRDAAGQSVDFPALREMVNAQVDAMRSAMKLLLHEVYLGALIYRSPEGLPPGWTREVIRQWQTELRRQRMRYAALQKDERVRLPMEISELMLQLMLLRKQQQIGAINPEEYSERYSGLVHRIRRLSERYLSLISDAFLDFETALDSIAANSSLTFFLIDLRQYEEALRVGRNMWDFWRSIRDRLSERAREGLESLYFLTVVSMAGETLNLDYEIPGLPSSPRALEQWHFIMHPSNGRLIVALYRAVHAYFKEDYKTALRWIEWGVEEKRGWEFGWIGRQMIELWLAILFETGRRNELRPLILRRIRQWGMDESPLLNALIEFIRANDYCQPAAGLLKGADALYERFFRHAERQAANDENICWYPYFDCLSWIEMLMGKGTYRELVLQKRRRAGIPSMQEVMGGPAAYATVPKAASGGGGG